MKKIIFYLGLTALLTNCSYNLNNISSISSFNSSFVTEESFIIEFQTYFDIELENIKVNDKNFISMPILKEPTYNFMGWYLDSNFQDPFDIKKIKSNTTVYAKWDIPRIETKILLDNVIELPITPYDEAEANFMIYNLSSIGEEIIYMMKNSNRKIILMNTVITEHPNLQHLKGVIPRGWSTPYETTTGTADFYNVYARIGYSTKDSGALNMELHETAHLVDTMFNNISDTEEFIDIWNEEKFNNIKPGDFYIKYREEYFADIFSFYFYTFEYRRKLFEYAPKTYYFMKERFSWGGN